MAADVHRAVALGGDQLVATALPSSSHLVRFHPAGLDYDRLIVVTELDEGRKLYLSGWIGKPLTLGQWRDAAALLFPQAEFVSWERKRGDGTFRLITLPIG
ncbi:hypothetical protein HNO88_003729 [Novosphingobium chloroacetimidivorans]|uniref:Uncharacterized protein n=1 Tax=Novosphingobium chloroacetimidivorans TaxID=1428314 RepID=A0A7W7KDF4_9SPHN|nr:hypothetical protein [Novosphingobium chloroacetimidivorans]MBB4860386.1 hypothetical protein [Novosphingobium chloroacetimidivorans]